jgi:hypothetical protein
VALKALADVIGFTETHVVLGACICARNVGDRWPLEFELHGGIPLHDYICVAVAATAHPMTLNEGVLPNLALLGFGIGTLAKCPVKTELPVAFVLSLALFH